MHALRCDLPERVTALVLLRAFCPGVQVERQLPDRELVDWIVDHWTTGHVLSQLIQHAPDPRAVLPELARFERYACTAATAGEIMRRNLESNVTGALASVQAPTLVTQCPRRPNCQRT